MPTRLRIDFYMFEMFFWGAEVFIMSEIFFLDMEVLAEMVTKAPTRVAIVEPCLGEPKDFEVLFLWQRAPIQILILRIQGVQGDLRECGSSWFGDIWKCLLCARQRDGRRCSSKISPSGGFHLLPNLIS